MSICNQLTSVLNLYTRNNCKEYLGSDFKWTFHNNCVCLTYKGNKIIGGNILKHPQFAMHILNPKLTKYFIDFVLQCLTNIEYSLFEVSDDSPDEVTLFTGYYSKLIGGNSNLVFFPKNIKSNKEIFDCKKLMKLYNIRLEDRQIITISKQHFNLINRKLRQNDDVVKGITLKLYNNISSDKELTALFNSSCIVDDFFDYFSLSFHDITFILAANSTFLHSESFTFKFDLKRHSILNVQIFMWLFFDINILFYTSNVIDGNKNYTLEEYQITNEILKVLEEIPYEIIENKLTEHTKRFALEVWPKQLAAL